ncbi:MAG: DegT/DnrJ/EryC1/StrS family aminotransferase [Candidatus Acidiferrales bacterium]
MKIEGNGGAIPFHRASLGEEEIRAVEEVIRSGWLTTGPRTAAFEHAFADYVGARHAIAVCSGTAALHLALIAAGIRAGDEVVVPANTFTATAEAVGYTGARPVLADIDPTTMNLDPEGVARRITPKTRAVIPVHLGGLPCDMDAIRAIACRHSLHVIEDAAHALPSTYKSRRIGAVSEFTCFSFYATKTLATGEGGMITTNNGIAAKRMRTLRLHGISREAWSREQSGESSAYDVVDAGFKYNLTDLQAAIGIVQLGKSDAMCEARRKIAGRYSDAFRSEPALEIPVEPAECRSSWHLYILRLRVDRLDVDRDNFMERLREKGIGCSVHFIPLHFHSYYQRRYGYQRGDFPRAEGEYRRCISLPIYPDLTNGEADRVISAVLVTAHECRQAKARAAHASA